MALVLNKEEDDMPLKQSNQIKLKFSYSAGVETVKYTHCTFAEGKDIPSNECPGYDTKQSDGEVLVILELWGMWKTPSLQSLPGLLWPGVIAPGRVLTMAQIELNETFAKRNYLK